MAMANLLADVFHIMLRNEPLLEAMVAAPLILKSYRWVLAACLLVAVVTFGVEMHNDYSAKTLFAPLSLALFAVQGVVLLAVSAAVFRLKLALLKAFGVGQPSRPRTEPEDARPE
jgi:hypothetical protein